SCVLDWMSDFCAAGSDSGRRARVAGPGERLLAVQDRWPPGDQLARAERFHQVVVGPDLQPAHAIYRCGRGRQHDDRKTGGHRISTELAADLQAVETREHEVEDEKIRALFLGETKRGQAVRGLQTLKSLLLKVVAHQVDQILFVINDEHRRGHSDGLSPLFEGDLLWIHSKLQPFQVSL